jgi:RNA recognition motif-containing protein
LRESFVRFGAIKNIAMKHSFAFITFEKPESVKEAIERMHGSKFINDEIL